MHDLPKPNTQALSWFYGEDKNGSLDLKARYQRNPIWSDGQKCFLIDSLISANPIPQVFLNIFTRGSGKKRRTIYEVVDGQQRLRTIIEYMNDEWPLLDIASKAYPVSSAYKPHIGKRYTELPNSLQDDIWNYPLGVQELRGWSETEIKALFRRLNYVVERLNKQELRHSQYFGEFVAAVEELADDQFWEDARLFSRKDYQRMKDIEFISELFIIPIDGIQDQQKTLDEFYATYDVSFPGRKRFTKIFRQVVDSLASLQPYLSKSRFTKKADFYGLFAATAARVREAGSVVDLSAAITRLRTLETS